MLLLLLLLLLPPLLLLRLALLPLRLIVLLLLPLPLSLLLRQLLLPLLLLPLLLLLLLLLLSSSYSSSCCFWLGYPGNYSITLSVTFLGSKGSCQNAEDVLVSSNSPTCAFQTLHMIHREPSTLEVSPRPDLWLLESAPSRNDPVFSLPFSIAKQRL